MFSVERILRKRLLRGEAEYLIKWDGYDESYNSWEPKGNIMDPLLIQAFETKLAEAKSAKEVELNQEEVTAPAKGKKTGGGKGAR